MSIWKFTPTRTSVGIILCRINGVTSRPEVLLVHKRYTYAFADFIHGRYSRKKDFRQSVSNLLNKMTSDELLDVWSLNFDQMWYRVWLNVEQSETYNKRRMEFQNNFLHDNGELLQSEIKRVQRFGSLMWEAPKGRHNDVRESDINCAIREVYEETGIPKKEYKIIPNVTRTTDYISNGTRFKCKYYIAIMNSQQTKNRYPFDLIMGRNNDGQMMHLTEVSESKWFDIEDIRHLDKSSGSKLEFLIAPAIDIVKKEIKGRRNRQIQILKVENNKWDNNFQGNIHKIFNRKKYYN